MMFSRIVVVIRRLPSSRVGQFFLGAMGFLSTFRQPRLFSHEHRLPHPKGKSLNHREQGCREPQAQPAGRKVLLVKPPHASLPKPVAQRAELTPANPLFAVQTTDDLRADNLLNQT